MDLNNCGFALQIRVVSWMVSLCLIQIAKYSNINNIDEMRKRIDCACVFRLDLN